MFANTVTMAPKKEKKAENKEGDNNVVLETAQLYCRKMVFGRYKQTETPTQRKRLLSPPGGTERKQFVRQRQDAQKQILLGENKNLALLLSDPPR